MTVFALPTFFDFLLDLSPAACTPAAAALRDVIAAHPVVLSSVALVAVVVVRMTAPVRKVLGTAYDRRAAAWAQRTFLKRRRRSTRKSA